MAQTKPDSEKQQVSICPNNEVFPLPVAKDYKDEFQRLKESVERQKQMGREIVVVMGVGFVGAVMAGVVADAVDPNSGELVNVATGW